MNDDDCTCFWFIAFVIVLALFAWNYVSLHECRDETNDAQWRLKLCTMRYESCDNTLDYCKDLFANCRYEVYKQWIENMTVTKSIVILDYTGTNQTEADIQYEELLEEAKKYGGD